MRAVGVTRYGGPEVLELVELPSPHPGPGEVRVRVQAAALNPADVMLRDGSLADWYRDAEPPFVPGMDIAGIVDQVGTQIDPGLQVETGLPVVGVVDNHGRHGGYSEYVVLPAESLTASPAGATPAAAASFLMPALTARVALDELALPASSTLLVTGAAGGVGRFAVALAHAAGLRVIGLASAGDEATVRGLGAEAFVARSPDPAAAVRTQVRGGVAAVVDAAALHDRIAPAVADGGSFVTVRGWGEDPGRGIRLVAVNVREHVRDHATITRLREDVEAGILPLGVAATFPVAEAVAAHRALDQGHVRGRIVLLFDDDTTPAVPGARTPR